MENYFNYFTEIEECYRRCRSTPSLLSPLDWALVESWKESGIPLAAVLVGIERSFAKFQKRPRRLQNINSIAYCTQEILKAAQEIADSGAGAPPVAGTASPAPPFSGQEIRDYLGRNVEALAHAAESAREPGLAEDLGRATKELRAIAPEAGNDAATDFEGLEQKLSALEDIMGASLLCASSVELLAALKAEVARGLGPSRRNMPAAQIESLERQFLKKRLFEHYRVPRLSLFYL